MEYVYHLLRTWRDLIYPGRQALMLRLFAWYKTIVRLIKAVPQSPATMIYACAVVGIALNRYTPFFSALATVTAVWLVRPSTTPKSSQLLFAHSARFVATVPLALVYGIGGIVLSSWLLAIISFFVFEVPFSRIITCFLRFCLTMAVSLLPVGIVCLLIDYSTFITPLNSFIYSRVVTAILPLIMASITVPLLVESFHTHRAWYDPL